jgi:ATP-dependent protease ClpP protease subunit
MIKILLFLLIWIFNVKCSHTNITNIIFDQIANTNKIILSGEINKVFISRFINQIELMTELNSDKNIFIIIDSIGGDLIEGIQFINWMEEKKLEKNLRFECICIKAISTAFNIFQLCDYRYVIEQSLMIQHEPKIKIEGTFDFVSNYYLDNFFQIHLDMYNKVLKKIANRLNISVKKYKSKFSNGDWIINNIDKIFLNNLADEKI